MGGVASPADAVMSGDAALVTATNSEIMTNRAKAGGGGPSCGGGAWCMSEVAVSPGDTFNCSVGLADPTGGGGDGLIIVEW